MKLKGIAATSFALLAGASVSSADATSDQPRTSKSTYGSMVTVPGNSWLTGALSANGYHRSRHKHHSRASVTKSPPGFGLGRHTRAHGKTPANARTGAASILASMDGNVFTFVGSYRSRDPLQTLDGQVRKSLIWFKKTGTKLRYVKVVMDLSTLAHFVYTGDVVRHGNAFTFTDRKLCYGTVSTHARHHVASVDFIEKTLQGCTPVHTSMTVRLLKRDVLDRHYLVDRGHKIALQRVYYRGAAKRPGTTAALTGTYRLMSGPGSTIPSTPTTTLQIYRTDQGRYRFSILTEAQTTGSTLTYNVGTGAFSSDNRQLKLQFEKVMMSCRSAFDLQVDNAPVYPAGVRIDEGCTPGGRAETQVYSYSLGQQQNYGITKDVLLVGKPGTRQVWLYEKYGAGTNDFPATTGVGAHYGWAVIPH